MLPEKHMSSPAPIIQLKNITRSFNGLRVLDGVSLDIPTGMTTVIIGPSGCGKSVLLKHFVLLLRPDSGSVFFKNDNITAMSEKQLIDVRRKIGFLFQGAALFDSMTVDQNVMFPLEEHSSLSASQRRTRAREMLDLVGLGDLGHRYPEELSGGQQKRVALARAIALHPEVILYDEPTTGLDPIRSDLINELILRLQKTLGSTAVVVTHDMTSARKVANHIVMLHGGRIVARTVPRKLDEIKLDVFRDFVEGRASAEELATIERANLAGIRQATGDEV